MNPSKILPKPRWLKQRLPAGAEHEKIRSLIKECGLHTVCEKAQCPNRWECYTRQTATFLILGPGCTRNCRFCAVGKDLQPPDITEPERVADAVIKMKLRYAVVTSVTRDDLPDGGAGFFAATIREIRAKDPDIRVEVLIPDFQGNKAAIQTVIDAHPDVINHNIETVSRLYPLVRPGASYLRSLSLIRMINENGRGIPAKSGLMLGLGETEAEIIQTLQDLRNNFCDILTLGQYLQPSRKHLPVQRYIAPEEFSRYKEAAIEMGFRQVASGPFVRSSYQADKLFR